MSLITSIQEYIFWKISYLLLPIENLYNANKSLKPSGVLILHVILFKCVPEVAAFRFGANPSCFNGKQLNLVLLVILIYKLRVKRSGKMCSYNLPSGINEFHNTF